MKTLLDTAYRNLVKSTDAFHEAVARGFRADIMDAVEILERDKRVFDKVLSHVKLHGIDDDSVYLDDFL